MSEPTLGAPYRVSVYQRLPRCESRVKVLGAYFECSVPAVVQHNECHALVASEHGQDVSIKWRNLTTTATRE